MTVAESASTINAPKLYKTSIKAGTRKPAISGADRDERVEARRLETLDQAEYRKWAHKAQEVRVEYEAELQRLARLVTQCDYMDKDVIGLEEWDSELTISQVSHDEDDFELQQTLQTDLSMRLEDPDQMNVDDSNVSAAPGTSTGVTRANKRRADDAESPAAKKPRTDEDAVSETSRSARSIVIQEVWSGRPTEELGTQTEIIPEVIMATTGVNTRRWTYFMDVRYDYARSQGVRHGWDGWARSHGRICGPRDAN